jgi:hypothetical protein
MYKRVAIATLHAITCIQKGRIVTVHVLFSKFYIPCDCGFAKFVNLLEGIVQPCQHRPRGQSHPGEEGTKPNQH